jgi:hypothetical protein
MIQAKIKADTLKEYYEQIVTQQQKAHGKTYTAHHDAIRKYLNGGVYRELGVHQGATSACACLAGAESVTGVDIGPYDFSFIERSSHDPSTVGECDVLLIDSKHTPQHLKKELQLHASSVRNYIIMHDTYKIKGLHKVASQLEGWKVEEYYQENVGYTVLSRS